MGVASFYGAASLSSLELTNGLTIVAVNAFASDSVIPTPLASVVIPSTLTSIGAYVFSYCSSLRYVKFTNGLQIIGLGMFYSSNSLYSIVIPCTITSMGNFAFSYQSFLSSVVFSVGLTMLGSGGFYQPYSSSWSSIVVPSTITSLGDGVFAGILTTKVVLTNGLTIIGVGMFDAFNDSTILTNINIPSTVTTIGNLAFYYCTVLTSVTLYEGLKVIGYKAFGFTSLPTVIIPSSVTYIGNDAFNGIQLLSSLTLYAGLFKIGTQAFYGCNSLTTLSLPTTVAYIGPRAFTSLNMSTLFIPSSVNRIGSEAFSSCYNLKCVSWGGNIINNPTDIFLNSPNKKDCSYFSFSPSMSPTVSPTFEPTMEDITDIFAGLGGLITLGCKGQYGACALSNSCCRRLCGPILPNYPSNVCII